VGELNGQREDSQPERGWLWEAIYFNTYTLHPRVFNNIDYTTLNVRRRISEKLRLGLGD
jgi:hypothetical protein